MARLPIPGSDNGAWGDLLNEFLLVSHGSGGTIAPTAVGTAQLQDNSVTNQKLDVPTQTALAAAASKYTKPAGGIPKSDLNTLVQASLDKADSALQSVPNSHSALLKTSAYTLTTSDEIILANATGGSFILTLPTAVGNKNLFSIKKVDASANTITIQTSNSETIDGGLSATIKVRYACVSVVSDGTDWAII